MSQAIGANISEVSRTPSYDPTYGDSVTVTYNGTEDGCRAKAAEFRSAGYRYSGPRALGGGLYEISVTIPDTNDATTESAQETWELDSIEEQIEIWQHPTVQAMLTSGNYDPAEIRRQIEDAVAKRNEFENTTSAPDFTDAVGADNLAVANLVFNELVKGGGATPYKRPALRVRRTYSTTFAQRFQMQAIPVAWTSSSLASEFSIPSAVVNQLPDDGDSEAGYSWAWYESAHSMQTIPAIGRIEETRTWVFAKCSELLFTIY